MRQKIRQGLVIAVAALACNTAPREYTWSIEVGPDNGIQEQLAAKELTKAISAAGGEVVDAGLGDCQISLELTSEHLAPEGYRICSNGSESSGSLQISCQGRDARGLLYAAYDVAERIRNGEPLDDLEVIEEPYATYRQIAACSSDHQFYTRLIQQMPRWRMNALLLYSAYHQPGGWYIYKDLGREWFSTYLTLPIAYQSYPNINSIREKNADFQRMRKSFPQLLRVAHDHKIDLVLKFQILSYNRLDASGGHYFDRKQHMREDFPQLFLDGRQTPDWDSQAVYDFIQAQLEELFTLYPDLGGITATSDEMSTFNIGHASSEGTARQRYSWARRMVETVEGVCDRFDRRCHWDLHGADRVYLEALLGIARDRPGGLRLRAESVPYEQVFSDKFPSYPFEKLAEAGDGMCDHDIHMEGLQDFPWLPNIIDHYVVRHTMAGVKAGLRGGGAMWYIYRPHFSPINSLGQINMELVSRLLWNPEEPVEQIWDRWARRRFGPRAAESAEHLLRSTQDVLNGILYFNNKNATFWLQYGFPADLRWLMRPRWGQMIEYFQPPGTPLYAHPFNAASRERTIPMRQMRQEKQKATRQAQELLEYLITHRIDFRDSDYRILLPRYVALFYYARAAEQLLEALYNFTNLHIRTYDADCRTPRRDMELAMTSLEEIHQELLDDERLWLLEPSVYYRGLKPYFLDNIPSLLADLRFYDRVLTSPQLLNLSELSEEEHTKAQQIQEFAEKIREKFEKNAQREVAVEEVWSRWGYPGLE
jgi:hypothetical protein